MPKKFPAEFKRDIANVARRGDLTLAEVAHDFDVSVESVRRWMRQADIDDGVRDGLTTAEQDELVRLRREKRRLEMENEILREVGGSPANDGGAQRGDARNRGWHQHRIDTVASYQPAYTAVGRGGMRGYVLFNFPDQGVHVL
jgi:transposase